MLQFPSLLVFLIANILPSLHYCDYVYLYSAIVK